MLLEVWPFVRACRAAGQRVVLARVLDRSGSAGRPVTAAMAVAADGRWAGSVAGGCVDSDVLLAAVAVLAGAPPTVLRCDLGPDARPPWEAGPACNGSITVLVAPLFDENTCAAVDLILDVPPTEDTTGTSLTLVTELSSPYGTSVGPATCAGVTADRVTADRVTADSVTAESVMVEEVRPAPRLVIVGATDVAVSLSTLATSAGFRVVVLEPRPAWAPADRVPAATLVRAWPSAWLGSHPLGPEDALIALTHEPRLDDAALVEALRSGCGYVAAIGSRVTHEERVARLSHIPGVERIHGPAGLDLGGLSSALTALSMLAEAVAVLHGRDGGRLVSSQGRVHAW
jgi:xanthine dehydrogenase accessory factor